MTIQLHFPLPGYNKATITLDRPMSVDDWNRFQEAIALAAPAMVHSSGGSIDWSNFPQRLFEPLEIETLARSASEGMEQNQ